MAIRASLKPASSSPAPVQTSSKSRSNTSVVSSKKKPSKTVEIPRKTGQVRQFAGAGRRTIIHQDCDIYGRLLAVSPAGVILHVPTGFQIGCTAPLQDRSKVILHMLDADPEGWAATRKLAWGVNMPKDLQTRLVKSLRSYV